MTAERAELRPPPGAAISLVTLDDSTIIEISGEIDLAWTADAEVATRAAIERGLPIRLDLAGTTFIDSTGVGFIGRLAAAEQAQGRLLPIANGPRNVTETLLVSGLGGMVQLQP